MGKRVFSPTKGRRRPDDSVELVGVLAVEPFLIGVRVLAALHEQCRLLVR